MGRKEKKTKGTTTCSFTTETEKVVVPKLPKEEKEEEPICYLGIIYIGRVDERTVLFYGVPFHSPYRLEQWYNRESRISADAEGILFWVNIRSLAVVDMRPFVKARDIIRQIMPGIHPDYGLGYDPSRCSLGADDIAWLITRDRNRYAPVRLVKP